MTTPSPRPGILDIAPYVGGVHAAPGAARVMVLSANEGALGPSRKAMAACREAAETLHRYPDGGARDLRAAISGRFGCDAERIVCGAGSDELIALLVRGYAGPGDEVLYSRHGFLMYPLAAMGAGATPVAAPEADLTASVDALLECVSERTRMVFLANPNNPTGTYLPVDAVARLREGLRDDVLLVVDAAYAEFVSRNDYDAGIGLVEAHDNVVMLRTFSKIFGLAALRLGWAYGPPEVIDVLNRLRGPFNANAVAQAAGIAALEDVSHTEACRQHNDVWLPWLSDELKGLGLDVTPSIANFVLARFANPPAAGAAYEFLVSRGVIARAMGAYGLPDALRITIGQEDEMRATVSALAEHMGRS